MKWFIFMSLMAIPLGVLCQVTLDQPASEIVKPSQTLSLTCKVSGVSIQDSNYAWNWIRQLQGKELEWLARIYYDERTWYSPSLQSRLKISKNTVSPKNEYSLQLTGMKAEDTATYYCARELVGPFDHWGQGTAVTVTSAEKSAPKLFPMISCGESQNPKVIGCLAKGYMPDTISFDWTDSSNNNLTNGSKTYPSVYGSTFQTISHITCAKPEGDSEKKYFCEAKHPALTSQLKIDVPCSDPKPPKIPIISIHPPSKDDWNLNNQKGSLVCMMKNFYPRDIAVKFLKDGQLVPSENVTSMQKQDQGDFNLISSLEITKKEWDTDTTFTCLVIHPSSETNESRNVSASLVCGNSPCGTSVAMTAVPPSFEELYHNKEATLTCLVKNMPSAEGLQITWHKNENDKEVALKTNISKPQYQDGSFSAIGTTTVCSTEWNDGTKYTCKVVHPDLVSAAVTHLKKEKGKPYSEPSIYIFPPPSEELIQKEKATITCMAKGFSPDEKFMKWLVQNKEVEKDAYVNTESIQEKTSDGSSSFTMYSKLTIEEKSWSSGEIFTCIFGHDSLPFQVIQKSIDKSSGKPSTVNISLVMSDSTSTCYL